MVNHIRKILLSGAVLAASAQAAQNINVNVPFAFRTPSGELPAGAYTVEFQPTGTNRYVQFRNVESRATVLFQPSSPVTNVRGTERPRMIFSCAQSGCSLQRIWQDGVNGFDFPAKKLTPAESERLAVVPIEARAAE
jgi:hypothetical protein